MPVYIPSILFRYRGIMPNDICALCGHGFHPLLLQIFYEESEPVFPEMGLVIKYFQSHSTSFL